MVTDQTGPAVTGDHQLNAFLVPAVCAVADHLCDSLLCGRGHRVGIQADRESRSLHALQRRCIRLDAPQLGTSAAPQRGAAEVRQATQRYGIGCALGMSLNGGETTRHFAGAR